MGNEEFSTSGQTDWIEYIAEKVYKYYNNRKIVLWGKYEASDRIKEVLKRKYGLETAFYVDSDAAKIDHKYVFETKRLFSGGGPNIYYVVIPLAFYQSLKDELTGGGYKKNFDYYYFNDCILKNTDTYYEDVHGNKIIGEHKNLKFAFSGFHAVVEIGEYARFYRSTLYMHNGSKIIIGEHVSLNDSVIIVGNDSIIILGDGVCFDGRINCFGNMSKLEIGSNGHLSAGQIKVAEDALLKIGRDFSIEFGFFISACKGTEIMIGDDCMFSHNVLMLSNDGHSIFNLKTGENINTTDEINKKRKIIIGNHVWVGTRTTILYNTVIGDGSIIGAASLVKSKIPNNCIAAGTPAKVRRTDMAWTRE